MKTFTLLTSAALLLSSVVARGDTQTETIQQKLKDQGFYYGAITGKVDTDTTAAIRRYQIRNGLKISGEMNSETAKSLGVSVNSATKSSPRPAGTPAPRNVATPVPRRTAPLTPAPPAMPQRDDARGDSSFTPAPDDRTPPDRVDPSDGYAPGPRGLQPEVSGFFDGTPFEVAPPDVQRKVIVGAQALLAQEGFYRGAIDGIYGRGLQFSLRSYQARRRIAPSGALDMDTLAALGLLPGQRGRGGLNPRRRIIRQRSQFAPTGERIYEPY